MAKKKQSSTEKFAEDLGGLVGREPDDEQDEEQEEDTDEEDTE